MNTCSMADYVAPYREAGSKEEWGVEEVLWYTVLRKGQIVYG